MLKCILITFSYYICRNQLNDIAMLNGQHDSLSVIAQSVVTGGTATVLASPDHTTQILSIVLQILGVLALIFRKK